VTRPSRFLAGLSCVASLAGCSTPEALVPLDEERAAIVGGTLSDATDDGVVFIEFAKTESCSGSLIAPNLVLTAMHCVVGYNTNGTFSCNPDGSLKTSTPPDGQFSDPDTPSAIGVRVGVMTSPIIAHATKVITTGSGNICQNDLALIVLDTELSEPLVPLRFGKSTVPGEYIRAVGYGTTNVMMDPGRHTRSHILVSDVGYDGLGADSTAVAPRTLVVGEGPCHGDSGGPALSEETGAAIGVYSLIASASCTTPPVRNVYTQIAPFESVIRGAFKGTGYEPIVEGTESGSGGDAGATGQAGEPGMAGAGAEGGVPGTGGGTSPSGGATGGNAPETGGTAGAGGGFSGSAAVDGTAGSPIIDQSQGTGSRRDPSCTCRVGSQGEPAAPSSVSAALAAAFALAFRRRRSK
jgi:hypothetical protein